ASARSACLPGGAANLTEAPAPAHLTIDRRVLEQLIGHAAMRADRLEPVLALIPGHRFMHGVLPPVILTSTAAGTTHSASHPQFSAVARTLVLPQFLRHHPPSTSERSWDRDGLPRKPGPFDACRSGRTGAFPARWRPSGCRRHLGQRTPLRHERSHHRFSIRPQRLAQRGRLKHFSVGAETQDPAAHLEGVRHLEGHLEPTALDVPELLGRMPQPVLDVPGEAAREDDAHGDDVALDDPPRAGEELVHIELGRPLEADAEYFERADPLDREDTHALPEVTVAHDVEAALEQRQIVRVHATVRELVAAHRVV